MTTTDTTKTNIDIPAGPTYPGVAFIAAVSTVVGGLWGCGAALALIGAQVLWLDGPLIVELTSGHVVALAAITGAFNGLAELAQGVSGVRAWRRYTARVEAVAGDDK